jgi:ferredoxin
MFAISSKFFLVNFIILTISLNLMVIKINYEKCCWKEGKCSNSSKSGSGCGCGCKDNVCNGCVEACPVGALERKDKLIINEDMCIDCGACIAACKHDALTFE